MSPVIWTKSQSTVPVPRLAAFREEPGMLRNLENGRLLAKRRGQAELKGDTLVCSGNMPAHSPCSTWGLVFIPPFL